MTQEKGNIIATKDPFPRNVIPAVMLKRGTRLKCKPCHLFYDDDGSVTVCEKCGMELKRIRVHSVKPESITVNSSAPMKKEKR